jgi:hypothetical protein
MTGRLDGKVAVVTGASSGFGAAIARSLAAEGARLAIGARRVERLEALSRGLPGEVLTARLDVTDPESVSAFAKAVLGRFGRVDILVNNAGGALGKDPLAVASEEDWERMVQSNFLGAFRMTRAFLPGMLERKIGHVVNLGSIAGHRAYEGGAGYCGVKAAVRSMTEALRLELAGTGVRVTTVDPGLAETEFSLVRFKGDAKAAAEVYRGMTPLTAGDVAECVRFALTRPPRVTIDELLVTASDQGGVVKVHRRP